MFDSEIILSLELKEKISKRIENTDFDFSGYVNYVLEQVFSKIESKEDSGESEENSEDQVQERMKRLESLGYLD